jgi:hypothetical protein
VYDTVPDPLPLAFAVTVTHGSQLASDHAHPPPAETFTVPAPPAAVNEAAPGVRAYAHPVPPWVTVTTCPAIVIVPVREPASGFSGTLTETDPEPEPLPQPPAFGPVTIVPAAPTATGCDPFHATAYSAWPVADDRADHVTPSALLRIVPISPTTNNRVPVQATAYRYWLVGDVCCVQVVPSGLVRIVPEEPTATNCTPFHVTPRRKAVVPDI